MLVEKSRFKEFLDAVGNDASRAAYRDRMKALALNLGLSSVDEMFSFDRDALTDMLLSWVKKRRNEIAGATIHGILTSLSTMLAFYDEEDRVAWKRVLMAAPKARSVGGDRAPTRDEITDLLDVCDMRMKFAVTAMCSGGFRVGAWDYLRIQDLSVVEVGKARVGRIVIYRGEAEEYITFISPESLKFYEKYVEQRRNIGEDVKPSSPLLRDVWQWQDRRQRLDPSVAQPLDSESVGNIILGYWFKTGRRKRGEKSEFKMVHGFRKFFETNASQGVSKEMDIEALKGRRYSYYKPTEKHLLEEYVKAIPYLTIAEPAPAVALGQEKEELRRQFEDFQRRVIETLKARGIDLAGIS